MTEAGLEAPLVDPVSVLVGTVIPVGGVMAGSFRMAPGGLQMVRFWAFKTVVPRVAPTAAGLPALGARRVAGGIARQAARHTATRPITHPDSDGFTPGARPVHGRQTWSGRAVRYIRNGVYQRLVQSALRR
jgi:hypothetical protein